MSYKSDNTELAVGLPPAPSPSKNKFSRCVVSILIALRALSTFAKGLSIETNFGEVKFEILSSIMQASDINFILYPNFSAKLISSILIFEIPSI